jgi:hypothetical protein
MPRAYGRLLFLQDGNSAGEMKFFPTGITVPAGKRNKKVFQVNVQALGTRSLRYARLWNCMDRTRREILKKPRDSV